MKKWRIVWSAAVCSVLFSLTVFAAGWRQVESADGQRWRYENEDGSYVTSGWHWLDGNRDKTAECYYFDSEGWMASDTVTPDGYQVNADGAWVENGGVMARTLEENTIGGEAMLPITIQVGDQEFEAELYDSETARELISRFPMTIAMEELNGNEKYYYLPKSLPTDTREIGVIHEGDLMLFGSDCLVLFYKDFQTSYRYTRLGCVKNREGLSGALGRGSVTVTFR